MLSAVLIKYNKTLFNPRDYYCEGSNSMSYYSFYFDDAQMAWDLSWTAASTSKIIKGLMRVCSFDDEKRCILMNTSKKSKGLLIFMAKIKFLNGSLLIEVYAWTHITYYLYQCKNSFMWLKILYPTISLNMLQYK